MSVISITTSTREREACTAPVTALPEKPYTAEPRQIWGWGIGRIAEFGLIGTFGQAMTIFTVGFGLSPVIVGWCMMLPRLVDGVIDPLVGHWSDDTHTRWGRRKPFMIGGAFIGAMFLASLWWANPTWSPVAQFLYLGVIGMCLYLCYGAYAMGWNAVGYELSDDYHERSRVAAIGGFFLAAMVLFNSWIYWIALRPAFGNVIRGMRWIGAGMAVAIVISAAVTCLMTKERFTHTNRKHAALWPAVRTTLRNRAFSILLLMKVFEMFGGRLIGGMSFFLTVYYVCRGDQNLATKLGGIGATLGTIWSFAVLPLVKPASKWIGKRGALIVGSALSFVGAVIAPFITLPAHPYWGLIPGLVIAPLMVISGTIAGAILPDICDEDELVSGQRREGLFTSVMGLVSKMEISAAVVLVGYVVMGANVDTKINLRWEGATKADSAAITGFATGESAVFAFKDAHSVIADTLDISVKNAAVELLAGNESPTEGFHPIGKFNVSGSGSHSCRFSPVTARYFEVKLLADAPGQRELSMRGLTLMRSGSAVNLLSPEAGGRLVAAQPPRHVVNKLFWLVMIPGIVFTGLTLVTAILFPLTEARMRQVRAELDAQRLAKAAAGIGTDTVAEQFIRKHLQIIG